MNETRPIAVKAAVKTAMEYLATFQDLLPLRDVRLEETEYEDAGDWLITLSAVDNSRYPEGNLPDSLGLRKREYKVFRIDASSGKVKSMKVRSLVPTL